MNITKKKLFRLIFALEVVCVLVFFCLGPDGLYSLATLRSEIGSVCGQIETLEREISTLQIRNKQLVETAFFKEKIAREQLQMARSGDSIFLFD